MESYSYLRKYVCVKLPFWQFLLSWWFCLRSNLVPNRLKHAFSLHLYNSLGGWSFSRVDWAPKNINSVSQHHKLCHHHSLPMYEPLESQLCSTSDVQRFSNHLTYHGVHRGNIKWNDFIVIRADCSWSNMPTEVVNYTFIGTLGSKKFGFLSLQIHKGRNERGHKQKPTLYFLVFDSTLVPRLEEQAAELIIKLQWKWIVLPSWPHCHLVLCNNL